VAPQGSRYHGLLVLWRRAYGYLDLGTLDRRGCDQFTPEAKRVIGLFFLSRAKESEPFSDQCRHVAWFLDDGVTIREKHYAHLAPHASVNRMVA
jgi:hypothetical protein